MADDINFLRITNHFYSVPIFWFILISIEIGFIHLDVDDGFTFS